MLSAVAIFAIGLIANLSGHPRIILFVLEFGIIGNCLAELFRRDMSLGQTVFFATLFSVLLGFGFLFVIGHSQNMGPIEMILNYLKGHLDATIRAYNEMNISDDNALEFETYARVFLSAISKIFPSLMIVGTGFALWLNVVIAKPLFKIRHLPYPSFSAMDRWQAPDFLVWGLIASGFALFFFTGGIEVLAINALIVILAVYLCHGLSIVLFFLNKYHVSSWIRVGVYFLIIAQQLFLAILALAGLFDQWVDFRKIHRKADS